MNIAVAEAGIKVSLFKGSGGGTLWHVISQPARLYETVTSPFEFDSIGSIVRLILLWQNLAGSDWAMPEALVRAGGSPPRVIGHITRRSPGGSTGHAAPKAEMFVIVARVVGGMKRAMRCDIWLGIGHAGNVMACARRRG